MLHFFQYLAAKTVGALASVILAVGIVKMPQEIISPVVAQNKDVASIAQVNFSTTTNSTSTISNTVKKENNIIDLRTTKTKQIFSDPATLVFDACKNIEGIQEAVPTGWNVSGGVCSIPKSTASINDVVAELQKQNQILQSALDLQKASVDAQAAKDKAIADAKAAADFAKQQVDQAVQAVADLAAQQAAWEASRPFTQQEMAAKAKQILKVNLWDSPTSSIYFYWANQENRGDTKVVFYGQDILNKNGALYPTLTFENDQALPFYPSEEVYVTPGADSVENIISGGLVPITNRPGYFFRPPKTVVARPCNGGCGAGISIWGLYFKPEGWKYQIVFSYPGRQESTYEGTFNIPAN